MTDDRTLAAIDGSIKKWEDIVFRDGGDAGDDNCSLCQEFGVCLACPVFEDTESVLCRGTPYAQWADHHNHVHRDPTFSDFKVRCDDCMDLAIAELDYLRNLRVRYLNQEL